MSNGQHGASEGQRDINDGRRDMNKGQRDVVLDVAELRAGYGRVPVLHGISLQLLEGEAIGIVGHNGMGKSTLMKTVMGLMPSSGGRIMVDGVDVTGTPAHIRSRMGVGYVPQGRGILPGLSALDNLRLAWSADSGETEEQSLARVLDTFPRLNSLLDRRGGALSGGEQQILALARALMPSPWLLLLDEPSEGIQPSIVQEIGQILAGLRDRTKLSMLIVEQNLDLVLDVADRIIAIERGRVVRELAASEAKGGAMAELLGMGAARVTRAGGAAQASQKPAQPPASRSAPTVASYSGFGSHASASGSISSSASSLASSLVSSSVSSSATLPSTSTSTSTSRLAPPSPAALSRSHQPQLSNRSGASNVYTTQITPTPSGGSMATVKRPSLEQMKEIVASLHMSMSEQEVSDYLAVMEGTMKAYDRVAQLPDNLPTVRYPRTPGYRPNAAENAMNAWYYKTDIKGAPYGPLSGKRIVLKDNVCLAGVPMMNGASTLEGYVPDIDATLVARILDAGGTIVGKAHCEHFCLSGGSHTTHLGPVHNPYKLGYSAGGSSCGTAALVGAGEVEMGIGGDQGGSIRMPGSWCGVYGMKATHGLVPYTGVMPIENTIDHAGPMTTTVADNALLLEVIAGADGLDPRQYDVRVDKYTAALGRGVAGMRLAVITEGFGHENSESDVDQKVREAIERLRSLGAIIDEVSIPMHLDGPAIWTPIALEGLQMQMMHGNGMGFNWKGLYTTSLLDAHANWRARANELSPSLKVSMFAGEYFVKHYRGHFYAKAQNLVRVLKQAYDDVLSRYDVLLMPTTPMKATPIPPADASLALYCQRAFEMLPNTAPFDITGHPAMNVPCAISQGLPIGLQMIAKHYGESSIYRAAQAYEQLGDWRQF